MKLYFLVTMAAVLVTVCAMALDTAGSIPAARFPLRRGSRTTGAKRVADVVQARQFDPRRVKPSLTKKTLGVCAPVGSELACAAPNNCCGSNPATQVCSDPETDANNCGGCGNSCNGNTCCTGSCANLATDDNNCGQCGTMCAAGQTCQNGVCK